MSRDDERAPERAANTRRATLLRVGMWLGGLAILGYFAFGGSFRESRNVAVYSLVASVQSHLPRALANVDLTVRTDDGGWRVLCGYNYRRVCRALHAAGGLDTGWGNSVDSIDDIWRRPVLIAVRRKGEKWETSVLSKGRDGRLGTADDITVPRTYDEGKRVPLLPQEEVWREAR